MKERRTAHPKIVVNFRSGYSMLVLKMALEGEAEIALPGR
jgi:hypothetical protein